MKSQTLIYCLLIVFLSSCKDKAYQPEGLTKLSDEELIERTRQRIFPDMETVVYKNERGEVLSLDSLQKVDNLDKWATDSYVDEDGEVQVIVIRAATAKDKELRQQLQEAFEYQPPIELVDIDCTKKQEILQQVLESDQGMRKNGGATDPEIDRQNLITVISLIEQCGMPTLDDVDQAQMTAIWLAFQHGDNANRKKYLPLLEQAAKNGDLEGTQIAMMKDRTLMMDGKPQVYGTQVTKKGGEWILYELSDPETVNRRRAEMGFGPLQDYLQRWDIDFNVEQAEYQQ